MDNKYAIKKPFITTMADDLEQVKSISVDDRVKDKRVSSLKEPLEMSAEKTLKEKLISGIAKPASPELQRGERGELVAEQEKPVLKVLIPKEKPLIPEIKKDANRPTAGLSASPKLQQGEPETGKKFHFLLFLADKKITIGVASVVILMVAGGFYYWQESAPIVITEPQEPTIIEAKRPTSLISVFKDELITIGKDADSQLVYNDIYSLVSEEYPEGIFVRVLVKYILVDESRNIEYRQFSDFFTFVNNNLNVNFPVILSGAVEEFTFFIYGQEGGSRIGFIAKIKDGVDISEVLSEWENGSILADLKSFLALVGIETDIEGAGVFNNNIYRDRDIRYTNFGSPSSSIDYAVIEPQNYLVITTSRDSMYAVIDNLFQ